ncbi:MAG: phenol hydroxylase subunit [Novosphingobium sp.]
MARSSAAAPRKLVRVTGERNGLIEFEYGVGDLSMAIELMLPPAAFAEFCAANGAEQVKQQRTAAVSEEERAMGWRPSDVQRQF